MKKYSPTDSQNYIANRGKLQEYQCFFCFQFSLNMRRCAGPCRKLMCLTCLRQRKQFEVCLFCEVKAEIEEVQLPPLRFFCPSEDGRCEAEILTERELISHASQCQFIPEPKRNEFLYKNSYKCQCGAALALYDESRCSECGLRATCSICSKKGCRLKYCLTCRKTPMSRNRCPRGHILTKDNVRDFNTFCDLCQLPIYALKLRQTHTDDPCDIDVCYICREGLPQDPPGDPLEEDGEESNNDQESQEGQSDQSDQDDDEEDDEEENQIEN